MSKPKRCEIKRLEYNFVQVGSVQDNAGAESDYDFYEVGVNCIHIDERSDKNGVCHYVIEVSENEIVKIFNPNKVIYNLTPLNYEN